MYEKVKEAIIQLKNAMELENVNPTEGLPEELFVFSSTLIPLVNVDLLVTNENGQLLLSWRDDIYHGKGWHLPGGCVRLREKLEDRLIKTAEKELSVPIKYNPNPVAVRELMEPEFRYTLVNQLERCHNISFLYECTVIPGLSVPNIVNGVETRWFDYLPDNLLKVHIDLYGDIIENYFNGGEHND